jgi:3-deoxy-D-manno-octulosonate 8-phosphate phosphatase (KDO 8-P phosphatase)
MEPGTWNPEHGTRKPWNMESPGTLQSKAARIKLILFDVDGVLTDGTVLVHGDGSESKDFFIRDGIAMVWAERQGLEVGLLSARNSPTTIHRAKQLGLKIVYQGVSSKADTLSEILATEGIDAADTAYMGDDIVDLAVLQRAGLSAAPADAVEEVRARVDFVARSNGGEGAARELIETILRAKQAWDAIVAGYAEEGRAVPEAGGQS